MATTEHQKIYQLAKQKAIRYCNYQERTLAEVEKKLMAWGIEKPTDRSQLLQELQEDKFIDEQRYVSTFVRGRFLNKKWGKRKIYHELKKKQIDPLLIQAELNSIEKDAYLQTLEQLIVQKKKAIATQHPSLARQKIIAYLLQKGYELELIQQTIQSTLKSASS